MKNAKMYYDVVDIEEMLGISESMSYKIMKEMNAQLKKKGYLTIAGKVPSAYFLEKWYGGAEQKEVSVNG